MAVAPSARTRSSTGSMPSQANHSGITVTPSVRGATAGDGVVDPLIVD
jgi:hypothetical protein